jgi:hypothetical protein
MPVIPELGFDTGNNIPKEVKAVQARLLQEGLLQASNNAGCLREKMTTVLGGTAVIALGSQVIPTLFGLISWGTSGDFFAGYKPVLGLEAACGAVLLALNAPIGLGNHK